VGSSSVHTRPKSSVLRAFTKLSGYSVSKHGLSAEQTELKQAQGATKNDTTLRMHDTTQRTSILLITRTLRKLDPNRGSNPGPHDPKCSTSTTTPKAPNVSQRFTRTQETEYGSGKRSPTTCTHEQPRTSPFPAAGHYSSSRRSSDSLSLSDVKSKIMGELCCRALAASGTSDSPLDNGALRRRFEGETSSSCISLSHS
jgi:hypothetical protein